MPTFETITVEKRGSVAILTINRPDKLNTLNKQVHEEAVSALNELRLDESIRVLVITGAGEKSFVAGADISEFQGQTPVTQRTAFHEKTLFNSIDAFPKPVIAMVNGFCLGGGNELALACDLRMASESARFSQPEINLGIMPGGGGTQTLPRAVGERRAKELILTGKPFTATEAHAWGLVNEVFPLSELMPAALATASRIARNAPISVRQAKLAIHRGLQVSLRDGLALEIEAYNRMVPTEDRREGVLAFNEKRTPNFKGR